MRSFLLVIICLILSFNLFAQSEDIVKSKGIKSKLHEVNVGRIIFTPGAVDADNLSTSDFLTEYRLTNKSDLFFTAFMANSLTNYMHRLSPEISADSLARTGNFQFSLLVDGKLIYKSNLLPGAPSREIRDTETILSKPLINNLNGEGLWSESFWGRFMRSGGADALTDGRHLLRMEIRPYIHLGQTDKTGDLMAAGDLCLDVYLKPKFDLSVIDLSKIESYEGLEVSREKFDRNNIKELKGNIEAGVFKKINGIIVIKNNKLLIEEYFNDETRDSLHDPRSVGKSFASSLIGIAIDAGYIENEYKQLKDFYDLSKNANNSALKENTSLYQLLTMSSSFDGNDEVGSSPGNEENMYETADWVKFSLDLPMTTKQPKGHWHYFTAGVVLLGDVLNKSVPGGLEKYADEMLFKPLGITNYKWQYTPQGVPNTAGGIRLKAIDFAKYGQLYKNGGVWNAKQIISKKWIDKTFMKQKFLPGRDNEFYGYLFWNKTYSINQKKCEAWYCAGNGGNYIFVFKDQPLVIVITASAYGQVYGHTQVHKMMEQYILPAVID